ncbi:MAG: RlmE family RNA methyltransferase [Phycisphaeraceae bacterium]|nr:RlmE family RNA methyltransferase [Phycisphaeraceae bacterium]
MAQRRQLHDRYFKQAKAEGYRARSAFKLKQIDERRHLIRRGDRVLDLGCAPGAWLQVASELVGPDGLVVGLDLQEIDEALPPNVRAARGDVFKIPYEQYLAMAGGEPFDVVLSDMAPNTEGGGGGSSDHFRSINLCRRVLELVPAVLKDRGHLAMKVFEGEAYPELLRDTTRLFRDTKGFKPDASRDVSREMYIVAKSFRGGPSDLGAAPGADKGATG